MATIEAEDLPEDVTVLREKIAATIGLATNTLVDTTLVEACVISGLDYDKVADIAARCDLDPDELNEAGLGIINNPDNLERRERDGQVSETCNECNETKLLDMWRSKRGGWHIMRVECPDCGEEGSEWSAGVPDPFRYGILEEE